MWDFSSGLSSDDDADDDAKAPPTPPPPGPVAREPELPEEPENEPESEGDTDDENWMFSLPDLPKREGDLRPVDPIRAFDEEFSKPGASQPFIFALPEPSLSKPEPESEPEPELEEESESPAERETEPDAKPETGYYAYEPEFTNDVTPPAERFLGMLGELPATVYVFSPTGGVEELTVSGLDERGHLTAYGPDEFMETGFEFTVELRDDHGSGFDIRLHVEEAYFQAGNRALLHVSVIEVIPRSGERETPRLPVSELAEATIEFSSTLPSRTTLEVRVADVSPQGLALLVDNVPSVGDTMRVEALLGGRVVITRVRVTRIDPAAFGRYRVGCEIIQIGAADRAYLGEIASGVRSGDASQRRPDTNNVLNQSRAEQAALKERFNRGTG